MDRKTGVLVLNRSFMPINVTTMRRAFVLLFLGNAVAVDKSYQTFDIETWIQQFESSDPAWAVRTIRGSLSVPRVILLLRYDQIPKNRIRFSPRNIFVRDNYTCQYCGEQFSRDKLNLDHVLPRSRGGKTTWDNVVCACIHCNRLKGSRTPQEAGMPLLKKPASPSSLPAVHFLLRHHTVDEWKPFLLPH